MPHLGHFSFGSCRLGTSLIPQRFCQLPGWHMLRLGLIGYKCAAPRVPPTLAARFGQLGDPPSASSCPLYLSLAPYALARVGPPADSSGVSARKLGSPRKAAGVSPPAARSPRIARRLTRCSASPSRNRAQLGLRPQCGSASSFQNRRKAVARAGTGTAWPHVMTVTSGSTGITPLRRVHTGSTAIVERRA